MYELDAVDVSTRNAPAGLWLGEVVATSGLVVVVFGVVRLGRSAHVAFAVGGYITAAYWFTSSTSFANPAITIGRTLSDTFAGIAPSSAPLFVLVQLLGGLLGLAAAVGCTPARDGWQGPPLPEPADRTPTSTSTRGDPPMTSPSSCSPASTTAAGASRQGAHRALLRRRGRGAVRRLRPGTRSTPVSSRCWPSVACRPTASGRSC